LVADVLKRRNAIVANTWELDPAWLAEGRVALPQLEDRLDAYQARRLAEALRGLGVNELIAVDNETRHDIGYATELTATAEDLRAISREYSPFNSVILPRFGVEVVALCTKSDFHLVARPSVFVQAYWRELPEAQEEFQVFAADESARGNGEWQDVMGRLNRYTDWISNV
jgi:hypothetical protein